MSESNNPTAPPPQKRPSLAGRLRNAFVTGLVLAIPFIATFWILKAVVFTIDGILQPIIVHALDRELPGVGFLTMLVLFTLLGIVGRNVPGRVTLGLLEQAFRQIPLVRNVYNAMKELLTAFSFEGQKRTFREVCVVEYPRQGMFSIGFVTNQVPFEVGEKGRQIMKTVYLPTPPNPTTGILVIVPVEEVYPLDMTIEDGLKMALSGGIVSPPLVRGKAVAATRGDSVS